MTKTFVFSAAAMFLLSAGVAQADPANFSNSYVSLLGGWSFDPHLSLGAAHPGMDTGFNGGARLGTSLDNILPLQGLSLEADGFYTQSRYAGAPGGRLGSASFMGNLIYHLPMSSDWGFYGGAGVGAVDDFLSGPAHGAQTVLGWQGLGGIEYALSPRTSLFTEYRYQNAHGANIGGLTDVGNTSNNVSMGVKFNL